MKRILDFFITQSLDASQVSLPSQSSQDASPKRQKAEILDVSVFTPFLQVFPAQLAMHFWFWTTSLLSMTCRGLRDMFSDYFPLYKTVRIYERAVAEYKHDWINRYSDIYNWRPDDGFTSRNGYNFSLDFVSVLAFNLPLNY